MFERERTDVAEACRRLAAEGLVIGTAGNVSARAGESEVAISPTGATLGELEPEQVTIVDMQGEVVAGDLQPTSELDLHLGVYRRYGAGAVVHTHAPMATALSCVLDELPCVHYQMLLLGGAVPVAPYATFGTPELASSVLDALEGRSAALMANHGAITHGPDPSTAVELSLLLEWACTVYWRAAAIGSPRVLERRAAAGRGRRRPRARLRIHEAGRARDEGGRMNDEMVAIAMGVHVLDVLARPVEAIPEGQGATLVEEIQITAAGSAGGTALTLAKLGAQDLQRRRDRRRRGGGDADGAARAGWDRHVTPRPPRRRADLGDRPAHQAER